MENNIYTLKITNEIENSKNPSLYEIWNWEGDQSVLPYKWCELIKQTDIHKDTKNLKEFLKLNFYENSTFDKNSFFFITHRSDTAGCAYLENDTIKYLIFNKKHSQKNIEQTLIKLCVKRLKEKIATSEFINIDKGTTNVDLDNLVFK